MPFSWIRVSRQTSPKLHNCMGSDTSRTKFEECIDRIVRDDGGGVEAIYFELNGRWARVHFRWDTVEQRNQIIYDLEGDDAIDLLSSEEADKFGP
jgi:hypothetical protein